VNVWKVILATIVIFGAGVFTGGLLVNYVNHSHGANRRPQNQAPRALEDFVARPEILKTNFVDRLDAALHLTPEQRRTIEKIVAEGQQRNREIWQVVAPQMRGVLQETRQRIRQTLTEEQKQQFEELLRRPRRLPEGTNAPPEIPSTNSVPTNSPAG
jgi:uncharacterized membrane protein